MSFYDYKYRPQPDFPSTLEEIFEPFTKYTKPKPTVKFAHTHESEDAVALALVLPCLQRESITVSVDKVGTRTFDYNITIEAGEIPLESYAVEGETAYKKIKYKYSLQASRPVALDGALGLSYSEGVLCIEIPLTKPTVPKKVALQASLKDIDSNG